VIQASLNFEAPRSRHKDPASSRRAEDQMRRSGALKGQRLIALDLVKQFPGRSSKVLAGLGTLDRYQLARRLPELVAMGYVKVTQHEAEDQKWWPV
jgi:DNA-binding MarR family transcriptional regulator